MNRNVPKQQQQQLKKYNKKSAPSSAPIVLSSIGTKLTDDSQSEFKKFFQIEKRREEIQYYISKAIEWIMNGKFSYQRLKGLNLLLSLMAQFLSAESYSHPSSLEMDKKLFDEIHKNLNPEQNIVIALTHGIFRIANFYQDNLHHKIWILLQEQQPVNINWIDLRKPTHSQQPHPQWSIVEPICRLEKKKALMILEACCLLSPTCCSLLGCMQGIKSLLRILSQQTILAEEEEEVLHQKQQQQQLEQLFGVEEEVDWEEVKILTIETLESSIHSTLENAIILWEEGGIELFASIIRNDSLPTMLRTRAVEFLCFFIKLCKENSNHSILGSKYMQPMIQSLHGKLSQFLGSKLYEEFDSFYQTVIKMILNVTTNQDTKQSLLDLDSNLFDKFIEKIDSLGYSYY